MRRRRSCGSVPTLLLLTVGLIGCSSPTGEIDDLVGTMAPIPVDEQIPPCPDKQPPAESVDDDDTVHVNNDPAHCSVDYWAYSFFRDAVGAEVAASVRDVWWEGRAEMREYFDAHRAGAVEPRALSTFLLGDVVAPWCEGRAALTNEQMEADAYECIAEFMS